MNIISRFFRHVFYEQYKNFKVIFRNFSSLSMLVLGPLLLILLIGFAFSGTALHDIKLGVYSEDIDNLNPILNSMSEFGQVFKYKSIDSCLSDMQMEKVHICMKFSKGFIQPNSTDFTPSGEVYFYYDNTRQKLTDSLVNSLNKFLGVKAKEISLVSAKTILDNIQSLVVFLNSKKEDINTVRQEALSIRASLLERKAKLIELRDKFQPRYIRIKEFQKDADRNFAVLDSSYYSMAGKYDSMQSSLNSTMEDLNTIADTLDLEKQFYVKYDGQSYSLAYSEPNTTGSGEAYYRLSDFSNITLLDQSLLISNDSSQPIEISLSNEDHLALSLAESLKDINSLRSDSSNFMGSANSIYNDLNDTKSQFDLVIKDLDDINYFLESEINNTDVYIQKIDSGVTKIDQLATDLTNDLGNLEKLDPSLAEDLVSPISKFFEPIIGKLDNITLLFPTLLTIVIIFIAMLFANNVTLSEINSRAYFRNLIAPVSTLVFTSGMIITSFIVVLFQAFVLLVVAQFRFGISIFPNLWPILLVSSVLILTFIFTGMIIAYLFKSEQTSILTTTFLAIAFLLFSDVVVPLEAMPKLASFFAGLNPMIIGQSIFKKIILFNLPIRAWASSLYLLLAYAAIMLIILIIISTIKNKQRV